MPRNSAPTNHPVAAAPFYLRACNYYQMAERFRTPKDKTALDAYRTGVDCFHHFAALTDAQDRDRRSAVRGQAACPAISCTRRTRNRARTPCVVFFDGLDVTKEIQFVRGVPDLIKRGISCLVMDGPGTGEAIRFRSIYLRHDYESRRQRLHRLAGAARDVDAKKIGIVAISLGGYYAPRCAAMEPRFAACIAWGAIWDYHATWKKRIDASFKASLSVPGHHIMWILGVETLDEALKKLEPFRLDGVVQKMRCPFLLVHGADDEQIPLADAQALFDACGSKDKTLRVFTAEEGGAQHCQRDYLTLGCSPPCGTGSRTSWCVDSSPSPRWGEERPAGLEPQSSALLIPSAPAQNFARRLRAVDKAQRAALDLPACGGANESQRFAPTRWM